MKMPKIKMPKLSRRAKFQMAEFGACLVYAVGAAVYGALNYMEGTETGAENSWNAATEAADRGGAVYIEHNDQEYILIGKDYTTEFREEHNKSDDGDTEEE